MVNRKTFIETAALAATGLLLSSLEAFARNPFSEAVDGFQPAADGYQLKIMATNWGFDGSMDDFCAKAKGTGYDGIETVWPANSRQQEEIFTALKRHGLDVGFLCRGDQSNATENLATFRQMVDGAVHNTYQRPLYINCHSGKDYFSFEENKAFVDYTLAVGRQTGIRILHETHRSRMLYAAPVARHYMEVIPDLRLTFDVSHWCNVSESLLADQPATLEMTLGRVDHIHARIGHPEGPQVNDPRAPEWENAVKAHFAWWDTIVTAKRKKGELMTFLTEFGPPDYMPTLPYTREPLADQWAINTYMMQTLRKRYA
jgi:sugar phosphate isomerase/epimerase